MRLVIILIHDDVQKLHRTQPFCRRWQDSLVGNCGSFTPRSLTRHKTGSNLPPSPHWNYKSTSFDSKMQHSVHPSRPSAFFQSCTIVTHNTGSPYCCHSLNTYNICLCGTTVFIQWINNKTMAAFHSTARLLAQWNALLRFQSTLNELAAKLPADLPAPVLDSQEQHCWQRQTIQLVHTHPATSMFTRWRISWWTFSLILFFFFA